VLNHHHCQRLDFGGEPSSRRRAEVFVCFAEKCNYENSFYSSFVLLISVAGPARRLRISRGLLRNMTLCASRALSAQNGSPVLSQHRDDLSNGQRESRRRSQRRDLSTKEKSNDKLQKKFLLQSSDQNHPRLSCFLTRSSLLFRSATARKIMILRFHSLGFIAQ
jgi:hypothetical protein